MIKVLVTGAAGFVGRQIMRALACADSKLLPVVRTGKENLVSGLLNVESVISSSNIFAENEDWWGENCRDVDVIIHSAWYAEPGKYINAKENIDCLIGSLNLAKGAAKSHVKRFIGVGTCFEYDLSHQFLSIDTPIKPLSPYASAKAALYLSLSQWLPAQSVDFAWCRLFYLYGEGEKERRLASYIHKQLQIGEPVELTRGNQIRDFMDVAEAGKRIVDVALGDQVGPQNICSGIPVTVKHFAEKIADEYGRRDLLRFGVRAENIVDPPCVVGISNI
jgi:dTDP-6-deoxy-L-talose 4-dehydrogenase (NAD+)